MRKGSKVALAIFCLLGLAAIVALSYFCWMRIQQVDAGFSTEAVAPIPDELLAEDIPGGNPPTATTEPTATPSQQPETSTQPTSEPSTTPEADKPQSDQSEDIGEAPTAQPPVDKPQPDQGEPPADKPEPDKTWRDPNKDLVALTSDLTAADLGQWYQEVIVVDIDQQYVTYYRDGQIITEGPCVSGNTTSSPTPTGWYKVYSKRKEFNMNGDPKTYVDRFTVFNGGIGLHDAKWRSEFGGTIYQGNGSHGCINLPDDVAFAIYDNAKIGTRVAVLP